MALPYPEIWGKQQGIETRYPLALHLRDTAAVARVLWDIWLRQGLQELLVNECGPLARDVLAYSAGTHDVGKANSVFAFQSNAKNRLIWAEDVRADLEAVGLGDEFGRQIPPGFTKRHEQVSAYFLDQGVADRRSRASKHWHALQVLGHHGRLVFDDARSMPEIVDTDWGRARRTLCDDVAESLGFETGALPQSISPVAIVLLNGITILADRIASMKSSVDAAQRRMEQGELDPQNGASWVESRYEYFSGVVPEHLGVYNPIDNPAERILHGMNPRPLQSEAMDVGDGLWFAMAATGSGKTEAALLRHCTQNEGLLFLLPTQATTNAMMNRIKAVFAGTPNIGSIAHGLSSTNDFYLVPVERVPDGQITDGLFPSAFTAHGGARLLAPVSVATIDQAIMAGLPLKWTPLRLLSLANSHVIIDEAHTLDPYQTRLAEGILWWLGKTGTRTTILSATLPTWQRDAFTKAYLADSKAETTQPSHPVVFPSSEIVSRDFHQVNKLQMEPYTVQFDLSDESDIVLAHTSWALRKREEYPAARIGIIVNQIGRAQAIATALQESGNRVLVLHSRMTAAHRKNVERQLIAELGPCSSGEPLIVVGTQAIEASLDIDFDVLSTDLSPSPSIIQRAGRLWRRHDAERKVRLPDTAVPCVHVVKGTGKFDSMPYQRSELDRAGSFLRDHPEMEFPRDLQAFVEAGILSLNKALDDYSQDEIDESVLAARKSRMAEGNRIRFDWALKDTAKIGDYKALTKFAEQSDRDADVEYPTTRFIETDSARVVLVGDPTQIPGAWGKSISDLESEGADKKERMRAALEAVVPLSGKVLALARDAEFGKRMEHGPLAGTIALEVKAPFAYDPLRGLELI